MLWLEDIKKRYKRNPEPKEVSDARTLITDAFNKLTFVEDVHKYYIPGINGEKIELPSVSSIVHSFEPFVDWDEKCAIKAEKMGIPKEELARKWHETNITATHCGSKTHFFGENAMNMFIGRENLTKNNMRFQYSDDGYLIPYNQKEVAITKYYEDILSNDNVYPVMPEAMIYTGLNDAFKINVPYAGTFDILLAYRLKNKIVFSIHDFKTNAELYKDFSRTYGVMMNEPFGQMGFYSEPYSCYCIQLSLYQIGLMQIGIEIVDRNIIWLKDDGSYEKIKTPDLTQQLLKVA